MVTLKINAAFGSDGQLLGVAAITVYINELGTLTDLVTTALQNRTKGNVYPTIVIANCSIAVSISTMTQLARQSYCKSSGFRGLFELCQKLLGVKSFITKQLPICREV